MPRPSIQIDPETNTFALDGQHAFDKLPPWLADAVYCDLVREGAETETDVSALTAEQLEEATQQLRELTAKNFAWLPRGGTAALLRANGQVGAVPWKDDENHVAGLLGAQKRPVGRPCDAGSMQGAFAIWTDDTATNVNKFATECLALQTPNKVLFGNVLVQRL